MVLSTLTATGGAAAALAKGASTGAATKQWWTRNYRIVQTIPFLNEWQYYRDGLPVNQALLSALAARYAPAQRLVLAGNGAARLTVLRSGKNNMLLHVT